MKKTMKKISIFILSIAILFTLGGCKNSSSEKDTNKKGTSSTKKDITINEAKKIIKDDKLIFVDLRPTEEYIGWNIDGNKGGHIEGAIDFPKEWFSIIKDDKKLEKELARRNINKDKKIVLYSNKEVDTKIINKLNELGYKDVSVLKDGMNAWAKDKNLPVDKMDNYKVLVHPRWVEDLVNGKKPDTYDGRPYKIIHLSFGKEASDYEKGHIKGALHIDDSLNHIPGPRVLSQYKYISEDKKEKFWNRPSDKDIEKKLLDLGITKDTLVILYGPNMTAASRCAAVMMYAGVEDVRILNGGIKRWKLDSMPLEKGVNKPVAVKNFGTKIPANPNVLIDLDEELKIVNDKKSVVASIRSWPEYIGKVSGYTYIGEAGEIANARFGYAGSDPYHMEDYRNIDDTMFNYNIIRDRWKKWGITPDKRVSFHCGTGWRASETYMYALAMSWKNISIYDGGWYEWHLKKDTPRKEKGVPKDAPETPKFDY
ncbi:rhodanese-like domain-containing protein [Clostridium sporogenes]|uniref:rhodanese-like domain-containing protein n=1 Tax=Clostridium sporogenes TaxID=1509 RepID=UPI00080A86B3|nr:rhodanese-like domain-containing protein [Clostridium sporogenes]